MLRFAKFLNQILVLMILFGLIFSSIEISRKTPLHAQDDFPLATENLIAYVDPVFGYSLDYPSDWIARPTPSEGHSGLAVFSPNSPEENTKIEIGVWPVKYSGEMELLEWFEVQQLPHSTTENVEAISFNGIFGWVIERKSFDGQVFYIGIVEQDQTVYFATLYGASNDNFLIFENILMSMMLPPNLEFSLLERTSSTLVYPNGIPNSGSPIDYFSSESMAKFIVPVGANYGNDSTWTIVQTGNHGQSHNCPASANQPNCGAIDISLPIGTPVYAAHDGYITYAGDDPGGFGKFVVILHDGSPTYSLYAHLNDIAINHSGPDPIQQGQLLGWSGDTGYSKGPHLHFGISLEVSSNTFVPVDLEQGFTDDYYPGIRWNSLINGDPCPTSTDCGDALGVPEFFTDPSYQGDAHAFSFDVVNLSTIQGSTWNDSIESFRVPSEYAVRLYNDPGIPFAGEFLQTIGREEVASIDSGFSNQASAIDIVTGMCPAMNATFSLPFSTNTTSGTDCEPTPPVPPTGTDLASFTGIENPIDTIVVSPEQAVHKSWWILNTGTTIWGSGYQLVFTSGKQMGAPSTVSIPAAAPGEVVELNVDIIAPSEPGTYRGYWRLRNPQGTYFGDELWVQVNVSDDTNPPPTDNYALTCINCPTTVEPGQTFRPTLRVTVGSGQLLESRGDMLRHKSGDLFGAWPHVAVVGTVNQGQTYDFTFYADNPITAPASDGTYQSTWQLWQNGQWVGPEYVIQFTVGSGGGSNYPPNKPTLTGPGDWAVYQGNGGIVLSANHNGDPDGDAVTQYYFEIFESAQNASSGWISSSSWSPQGLGYYGYQWRVKVRDSKGAESGWSETWHFSVYDPTIDITQLEFVPLDGAGEEVRILACADAPATLRVDVNTATDGSSNGQWNILKELGVPCFNNIDAPVWNTLEYEAGTHLVRVLARGDGGWENAAVREETYTVPANHRPNTPTGFSPPLGAYVNSQTVTFVWKETLRTTSYRLEISLAEDYSTLLYSQEFPFGTTEHTYTFDSDYETVYWRVIAIGPYGSNQTNRRLHIDIDAANSSITSLPGVTTDTQFSVYWSGSDARSGLRWYDIQVRDGDRPDSEWTDWLVNTTKMAEIFQGQTGHTYYFRVRSMDEVGNWETWPSGDGDTYTLVDPTAAPPTQWWNDAYAQKRNLIILNNDSDVIPTHYPMHIHFDSTTTPTAAEIFNASLTLLKGNDVRIVYNDETELPLFIQRFTSQSIDIWFPLQVELTGGQSNDSNYQIYYGNGAASSPSATVNAVFLPQNDSNTVALWHFQENTGNLVNDSSGKSHNGTFVNSGWTDGWLGWAGVFNGTSSYVDAGNSNDFNIAAGPMTIEAWIYLTGTTGDFPHLVSKWGFGENSYFFRLTGDRKLQLLLRANGGNRAVTGNTALELNQWYHVAVTYDGTNIMRTFINGVQTGMISDGADALPGNRRLFIGWAEDGADGGHFPGYIQHVRISNTERTSFPYAKVNIVPSVVAGSIVEPPISGSPDLALLQLNTFPNPGGGVLVQAVFANQGDKDTGNGFYIDLYLDQLPEVANSSGSVLFWVNDTIVAGSIVTVTNVIDSLTNLRIDPLQIQEINGIPEVSGTLYAQVDSTGVVPEIDNNNNIFSSGIEICFTDPDGYESDDSFEKATNLLPGIVQTHNIHSIGDEDWFAIEMEEGEAYIIKTLDLSTDADTYLYLFDEDGETLLASNDDFNGTLASEIHWTATASGTYYMRIKHWNPNISGCGTSYSVKFFVAGNEVYLPMIVR